MIEEIDGVALIAAERQRQIDEEGWTFEHDDGHTGGALAMAAAVYAASKPIFVMKKRFIEGSGDLPVFIFQNAWPFSSRWLKPKDRKGDLIRAGAMIAAEIDRLLRMEMRQ